MSPELNVDFEHEIISALHVPQIFRLNARVNC